MSCAQRATQKEKKKERQMVVCYRILLAPFRCKFGRLWRVSPLELELRVHKA
ncbi:MAG: hypothetical protein ACP5E9_01375 [Candidatus Methanospirareceae archaeon]